MTKVITSSPVLSAGAIKRIETLSLGKEDAAVFKDHLEEITTAYSRAINMVATCFDDAVDHARTETDSRKERIYQEYKALTEMVAADYGRVIGPLDKYRELIIAERDALIKDLEDVWNDQNRRETELANKLHLEMKRSIETYKKTIAKAAKSDVHDAINQAATQRGLKPIDNGSILRVSWPDQTPDEATI